MRGERAESELPAGRARTEPAADAQTLPFAGRPERRLLLSEAGPPPGVEALLGRLHREVLGSVGSASVAVGSVDRLGSID
eukprot:6010121-Alexandrium_andersonii.AAC.1